VKQLATLKLLGQYVKTALMIPYALALALYILVLMIFFGDLEEMDDEF